MSEAQVSIFLGYMAVVWPWLVGGVLIGFLSGLFVGTDAVKEIQ